MLLGKLAEKQQIGTFLKAEVAVLGKSGNQIFDIVTTIEELAVCGNRFTIDNFSVRPGHLFRSDRADRV